MESLSRTLKASRSWRSKGSAFICLAMRSRNRGKSNGAVRFSPETIDFSWAWVGFPPRDLIRIPSSDGAIRPSPSVSKSVKASFIDETWSSLRSLPIVFRVGSVFEFVSLSLSLARSLSEMEICW